MNPQDNWLQHYADLLQTLSVANLQELREIAAEGICFRDPFNDIRNRDDYIALMADMFDRLDQVEFDVHQVVQQENQGYLFWTFSATSRLTGQVSVQGTSRVETNAAGLICLHEDYWDGSRLMQTLPVIGRIIAWLRHKLACPA
ncbi:nuclear transport factor 2 family protein [Pontibacter sp. JAM-7]|uniref:nuclear transport factor 2 family protein n=1 Tax=Pontibacter sp. JAM-7 TaxID=3366581 RepID=UPI003AF49C43